MSDEHSGSETHDTHTEDAEERLPQPDPARDKPSQAEGDAREPQRVSPVDPARDKPSQAEGDVGDYGET